MPAAGTNRRLTAFGSTKRFGRGRVEVVDAGQDSAPFGRDLAALDARHEATERRVVLVVDNAGCRASEASRAALAARTAWLEARWMDRSGPEPNPKERARRRLERDTGARPAPDLRASADAILEGPAGLGGGRRDIGDEVPPWWPTGHRRPPTGRPSG